MVAGVWYTPWLASVVAAERGRATRCVVFDGGIPTCSIGALGVKVADVQD